ncbi:MAG: bifunctional diaminohydroxyphosphoribosylaminopyrimidine deaminase/5-amino-6-(5-phosphoribosylamino)uracil reductase RibD [Paenibacillaceae bacterium]
MDVINDQKYMRLALQLAEATQGQTDMNPVVGCVVVKSGRVVGTGAHLQRGGPHAEVHALNMAGKEAEGSTVYVTLEPCSHHGRTPPCANRLIEDKVSRVVVATIDPNPVVAGTGIAKLREHGIEVVVGVMEQEARALNLIYEKYMLTQLPYVTMKTACSLDGKIASRTGDSKWISNDASRQLVHTMRHQHQAIMVGIETVLADNPSLNTRLSVPSLQPIRIVVDSKLRTPDEAQVVTTAEENRTIILTTELASQQRQFELEGKGVRVIRCGAGPHVDLKLAMQKLGEQEINSILLEGGGRLNGAMLETGLIDRIYLFYAPLFIGGSEAPGAFSFNGIASIGDAIQLEGLSLQQIDNNFCVSGYPSNRWKGTSLCSQES